MTPVRYPRSFSKVLIELLSTVTGALVFRLAPASARIVRRSFISLSCSVCASYLDVFHHVALDPLPEAADLRGNHSIWYWFRKGSTNRPGRLAISLQNACQRSGIPGLG